MPTPTYTPLANVTLGSNASSITFSSISQSYKDLIMIGQVKHDAGSSPIYGRVNSTTGIYNGILMYGDGTTGSSTYANATNFQPTGGNNFMGASTDANFKMDFLDYSTTDKHKSMIFRGDRVDYATFASTSRFATTSAISSIYLFCNSQFVAGSTFALYGVSA